MNDIAFKLYLIFVTSWFIHLPARIPILGKIRLDLLLVSILILIIFIQFNKYKIHLKSKISNKLFLLIIFAFVSIPFSEWPGSVVKFGFPNFVKAIVFFYFTVCFVTTEKKIKIFIYTIIGLQTIRILEPLYLNITQGYWGSAASMANWEFMNRLSGGPYDTVNPNGLAFIIISTLPFLHFIGIKYKPVRVLYFMIIPFFIYAFKLTASRSGMIGLIVVLFGIFIKSKKKLLSVIIFSVGILFFSYSLSSDLVDRYKSLYDSSTKNYATANQRLEGIKNDFAVALRKPIFGHGLGTSREANANFGKSYIVSHNLYTEIAQELGFIGLIIFANFIIALIRVVNHNSKIIISKNFFYEAISNAIQILLVLELVLSVASYGLSKSSWYLLGGLAIALKNIIEIHSSDESDLIEKYNQNK